VAKRVITDGLAIQESPQIIGSNADRVDDPDMSQLPTLTEPVDGRVADAELLRDLGHPK